MQESFAKLGYLIRAEGLLRTLRRCALYPLRGIGDRRLTEIQKAGTRSEVFASIFEGNLWNSGESVSGDGSSLHYTENLRKELPELLRLQSIKRVYDAPCGDFHWMKHVVLQTGIRYVGADIVLPLIEKLKARHRISGTRFIVADIATDEFPEADLWICRDCLFHLSYADIYLALRNFASSRVPFLLTTTHIVTDRYRNHDIRSGSFRLIDLFSEPFFLPRDVGFRIFDGVPGSHFPPREMCLWTREQVEKALPMMEAALGKRIL